MEIGDTMAELGRVTADLVQGDESRVAVVGGVLHALGHHCAGHLLEAHAQLVGGVAQARQQRRDGRVEIGTCGRDRVDGGVEVLQTAGHVGPVYGERDHQLPQRFRGVEVGDESREARDLGLQDRGGDEPLAGHRPVQLGERVLGRRVDEQPAHLAQRVVAGRAVDRPLRRQHLAGLEDLLHRAPGPVTGPLTQPLHVTDRVGQPVRMVDAQPVDTVVAHPPGDLVVRGVEDGRVLDAQPGQRRHREEAAVVLVGVGAAEADQAVVLALGDLRRGALAGAVGDREAVLVVTQLAVLQRELRRRELVAEHRQQDRRTRPLDVEPRRVLRITAVLQDVPPGRVLGRCRDPGVVGDDVDDHPQPAGAGRGEQAGPAVGAAPRRVDGVEGDHVVAVVGTLGRRQDGRQVGGARSQRGHVVTHVRRRVQVEGRPDLQPVRRGRDHESALRRMTRARAPIGTDMPDASTVVTSSTPLKVSTRISHASPYSADGSVKSISS